MKKKTNEEFIQELKVKNPNVEALEPYINNTTKIKFKCLQCGSIYKTTPKIVLRGCLYPECGKIRQGVSSRTDQSTFIEKLKQVNPNIQILFNYVLSSQKIKCKCLIDNYEWNITPNNLLRGYGCPKCKARKCSQQSTSNTEEFIQKAASVHNNKYLYSKSNYISTDIPVIITCPIHGDFLQTPHVHLKGCGCPRCNDSHGEQKIIRYLNSSNIEYTHQYKVKTPTNIRKSGILYVDFYLPKYNMFIEYNGQQHYIPVKHFGGTLKFQQQAIRDNWLRDYCTQNNIRFIEIRYDDDIQKTLNKEIERIENA